MFKLNFAHRADSVPCINRFKIRREISYNLEFSDQNSKNAESSYSMIEQGERKATSKKNPNLKFFSKRICYVWIRKSSFALVKRVYHIKHTDTPLSHLPLSMIFLYLCFYKVVFIWGKKCWQLKSVLSRFLLYNQ